jgi:hypothetical protein
MKRSGLRERPEKATSAVSFGFSEAKEKQFQLFVIWVRA